MLTVIRDEEIEEHSLYVHIRGWVFKSLKKRLSFNGSLTEQVVEQYGEKYTLHKLCGEVLFFSIEPVGTPYYRYYFTKPSLLADLEDILGEEPDAIYESPARLSLNIHSAKPQRVEEPIPMPLALEVVKRVIKALRGESHDD